MDELAPNAVFDEPWHAELFAITVKLSEAGHFSWPEWTEHFGAVQKAFDGSTYYDAWLEALESLILERGVADTGTLAGLKQAWTEAYLQTPHGEPVELSLPTDHH